MNHVKFYYIQTNPPITGSQTQNFQGFVGT